MQTQSFSPARTITGLLRLGLGALLASVFATAALACPSWNNPTVFGSASIPGNFTPDPYVRNLTAGGRVNLANCFPGQNRFGYVITRPDFRFQYGGNPGTGQLTIALEARSAVDTVLLVNAPDGSWHYNDDINLSAGNTNSAITFFSPLPGQYDVWTGSYDRSSNNPAVLVITEFPVTQ